MPMFIEITEDDQILRLDEGEYKGKKAVKRTMKDGSTILLILDQTPSRQMVYKVLDVFHVELYEASDTKH